MQKVWADTLRNIVLTSDRLYTSAVHLDLWADRKKLTKCPALKYFTVQLRKKASRGVISARVLTDDML